MRISDWSSDVCSSDLKATADGYFADAAQHYDQFYGQLSRERLGQPQPRPTTTPTLPITTAEETAVEDDRLGSAARARGARGAGRDQAQLLREPRQEDGTVGGEGKMGSGRWE